MKALISAIALARTREVPYSMRKALVDQYGSAENALVAAKSHVDTQTALGKALLMAGKHADLQAAQRELDKLQKMKAWVLCYGESSYPAPLAEIHDPPLVLFGLGQKPEPQDVRLGVVGSRRASPYGLRVTRFLASDLAHEGLILVSGMARGIDAAAHEAALKARTPTIAVMASGLDRTYPPEHRHLKDQIASCGSVVTEFFLGQEPQRSHFPQRNRIISGLSRGILMVEAGERSGAKITADHAISQNRDVYAVPGPIDAPLSFWPNRFIAEGARPVLSSEDILGELKPANSPRPKRVSEESQAAKLTNSAKKLLKGIEKDTPVSINDVAEKEGAPVSDVLRIFTELEMQGVVAKQADARYVRTK